MAVSISRRILSSFGSLNAGLRGSPYFPCLSFRPSHDLSGHSADYLFSAEPSSFIKNGVASLAYRRFSTSILTPGSSDGAFPSDLLSTKTVLTPDRDISNEKVEIVLAYYFISRAPGLVIAVTNFCNEDKVFMVLAGDVFDVPIKKHIVHRVVRWQLAKRQQLLVFENLELPTHKAKNIVNYYKQMENTKKLLLVDGGPINEKLKL